MNAVDANERACVASICHGIRCPGSDPLSPECFVLLAYRRRKVRERIAHYENLVKEFLEFAGCPGGTVEPETIVPVVLSPAEEEKEEGKEEESEEERAAAFFLGQGLTPIEVDGRGGGCWLNQGPIAVPTVARSRGVVTSRNCAPSIVGAFGSLFSTFPAVRGASTYVPVREACGWIDPGWSTVGARRLACFSGWVGWIALGVLLIAGAAAVLYGCIYWLWTFEADRRAVLARVGVGPRSEPELNRVSSRNGGDVE